MGPGIPGLGLGGLFFIISALLAPAFELVRTVNGRSSLARWRLVTRQAALAASIVLATTAMLWLLELILLGAWGGEAGHPETGVAAGSEALAAEAAQRMPLAATPVLFTFALLVVVLVSAELLRVVRRRPGAGSEARTTRVR